LESTVWPLHPTYVYFTPLPAWVDGPTAVMQSTKWIAQIHTGVTVTQR
jgi:hypothetical protein